MFPVWHCQGRMASLQLSNSVQTSPWAAYVTALHRVGGSGRHNKRGRSRKLPPTIHSCSSFTSLDGCHVTARLVKSVAELASKVGRSATGLRRSKEATKPDFKVHRTRKQGQATLFQRQPQKSQEPQRSVAHRLDLSDQVRLNLISALDCLRLREALAKIGSVRSHSWTLVCWRSIRS